MLNIDFELRNEITKEIPEILRCYQCGTCVSSCTSEKYGKSYSPRRKILAASYGDKVVFTSELWKCVTCNNCNERCPQEVNPYDVLVKLKNYSIRKGFVDEGFSDSEKFIVDTGRILQITDGTQARRKKLGLEEIKTSDELKKLVRK